MHYQVGRNNWGKGQARRIIWHQMLSAGRMQGGSLAISRTPKHMIRCHLTISGNYYAGLQGPRNERHDQASMEVRCQRG